MFFLATFLYLSLVCHVLPSETIPPSAGPAIFFSPAASVSWSMEEMKQDHCCGGMSRPRSLCDYLSLEKSPHLAKLLYANFG